MGEQLNWCTTTSSVQVWLSLNPKQQNAPLRVSVIVFSFFDMMASDKDRVVCPCFELSGVWIQPHNLLYSFIDCYKFIEFIVYPWMSQKKETTNLTQIIHSHYYHNKTEVGTTKTFRIIQTNTVHVWYLFWIQLFHWKRDLVLRNTYIVNNLIDRGRTCTLELKWQWTDWECHWLWEWC